MAEKVTKSTWFKNAAKSLGYGTATYLKQSVMPYTMEMYETNEHLITGVMEKIKDKTISTSNFKKFLSSKANEAMDTAREIKNNAISDIKTGKFVNKDRGASSMGFDDLDFDGGDFDFGDADFSFSDDFDSSDSAPDITNVSVVSTNIDKNNPMTKAVQAQSELQIEMFKENAERDISIANAQMSNNSKLAESLHAAIGTVNQNLGLLVNFNNDTMSAYVGSSLKYYESSLQHMETLTTELKKVSSYYERMIQNESRRSSRNDNLSVFGGLEGGMNFSEYGKVIKKNIDNYIDSSMILGNIKMMKSMNDSLGGKGGMFDSPLEFIPQMVAKILIPTSVTTLLKSFDETFKSFVPAFLSKLFDIGDDMMGDGTVGGFLKSSIASIFGIQKNGKFTVNTSNYEKGAVAFDGMTRKSIVEVIPTYLRKILSALTGNEEMLYNFREGKFVSRNKLEADERDTRRYRVNSSYDVSGKFKNAVNAIGRDDNERNRLQNVMDTFFDRLTTRKTLFNPDKDSDFDSLFENDNISEAEKRIIKQMVRSLSKTERMKLSGINHLEARNRLSDYHSEIEDDGEIAKLALYNNSDAKEFKVGTGRGINGVDSFGKRAIDYIRDIKDILLEGIGVWFVKPQRSTFRRKGTSKTAVTASDSEGGPPTSSFDDLSDDVITSAISKADSKYKYGNEEENKKRQLPKVLQSLRDKIFGEEGSQNFLQKIFSKGYDKVAEKTTGFFEKVNDGLYNLVFGTNSKDGEKKSILSRITDRMKSFYDDVKEKLFGKEGFFTKIKESDTVKNLKDKGKQFVDYLFGSSDEAGVRSGGLFSDTANAIRGIGNQFKLYVTGVVKDKDGNIIEEKEGSVFEEFRNIFGTFKDNIKEWFSNKKGDSSEEKEGFWDTVKGAFGAGITNFSNMFFGVSKDKDGNFTSKVNTDEIIDKIKERAPKSLAGGLVGGIGGILAGAGGFGVLGSLFLGPMSGVVIGTATGFLSQSDKFKNWLFGEEDENGERIGGFISKSTQNFFKEHKGALIGGAALGGLKGLLGFGFLPSFIMGGPITGALTGLAGSLLLRSETFQNFLFGSMGEDGQRSGGILSKITNKVNEKFDKEAFKNKAGTIGVGALGGAGLGAALSSFGLLGAIGFGPLTGAMVGIGAGLVATSDKWKDKLFGTFDEDGERTEYGLFGKLGMSIDANIMQPLKVKFTEWQFNIENWFETDIATPFANALEPFREEFNRFKGKVSDFFVGIGEKLHIPEMIDGTKIAVTGFIKKIGSSFTKLTDKAIAGVGKIAGSLLATPGKVLDYIGEKFLIPKHMKDGLANIRGIIISNLKESFQSTDFYINFFDPVRRRINEFTDWFKEGFKSVFTEVKDFAKDTLKSIFKTVGKAALGVVKLPFQMLATPFKAIGKVRSDLRESGRRKANDDDLAGILNDGGNRGVGQSLLDLASTFLPGGVRRAAQWSAVSGGASYVNGMRQSADERNSVYTQRRTARAEIQGQLRDIINANRNIMNDDSLSDKEKSELIKANKAKMNEIIDGSSDKIYGSKKFLSKFVEKEEKADDKAKAKAAKSEAKNKEKELKDKYGSSYTQQTKLEQDRFKMQSATASATEETAKNTKGTNSLLEKLFEFFKSGIRIRKDEPEEIDLTSFSSKEVEELKKKYDIGDITSPKDNSMDDKVLESLLSQLEDKSEIDNLRAYLYGAPGATMPRLSTMSSMEVEALKKKYNSSDTGFSTSLIDEGNSEVRTEQLDYGTHGNTAVELAEQHRAEDAMKEKASKSEKLFEIFENIKDNTEEHKNMFSGIFGKKGLITMGIIALLPLLMKFLKDPGSFFSGLFSGAGNFLSEILGLTDRNGDRTDATGDIQANTDAQSAVNRGAGYATSKALQFGDNVYQAGKKVVGGIKKTATTVREIFGKGADETAEATMKTATSQTDNVAAKALGKAAKSGTDDVAEVASKSNSTMFSKFRKLIKEGAENLSKRFAKKFPKISKNMSKVIAPILEASAKLTDDVLTKFTSKISALFTRLGITATGVGLAIDAAFVVGGAVSGATKASAANLFQVPQSAVDGTMRAISSVFEAIVNFSWFFVLDLADDIVESVLGFSILNKVATVLYKYIKQGDDEAIEKFSLAQDAFKSDFADYTLAQQLMNDNVQKDESGNILYLDANGNLTTENTGTVAYKDNSLVTESIGSYNDRANKTGLGKFFEKTGRNISTGWKSIFGSKGNEEEYNKALEQQKSLQFAVEQGLIDPNSEAYKLSMEAIDKSLAKNATYEAGAGLKTAGKFVVDKVKLSGDYLEDIWDEITKEDGNVFSKKYWTPPKDDDDNPLSGFNKALFYTIRIATAPRALLLQAGVTVKKGFDKIIGKVKQVIQPLINENDALLDAGISPLTPQYWAIPVSDDGTNPITGFAACAFVAKRMVQAPLMLLTHLGRGIKNFFSNIVSKVQNAAGVAGDSIGTASNYVSNGGSVFSSGYWTYSMTDDDENPLDGYLKASEFAGKLVYAPVGIMRGAGRTIKNVFNTVVDFIKKDNAVAEASRTAAADYINGGGSVFSSEYWTISGEDNEGNPLNGYFKANEFINKIVYAPIGLFKEAGRGLTNIFSGLISGISSAVSSMTTGSDLIEAGGSVFSKDYWSVSNNEDTPISPFISAMNFIGRLVYFPTAAFKEVGVRIHNALLENPTYKSLVDFGSSVKNFFTFKDVSEEDYWNAKNYGVNEESGFSMAMFSISRMLLYPAYMITNLFDGIGDTISGYVDGIKEKGSNLLDTIKGVFGGDKTSSSSSSSGGGSRGSNGRSGSGSRSFGYVPTGGEDIPIVTNMYGMPELGLPYTGGAAQNILTTYRQTSQYGKVRSTGKVHKGVDLTRGVGSPVLSFTNGQVIESKRSYAPNSGRYPNGPGYGNYVKIKDDKGYIHVYGHLNSVSVSNGQTVRTGTELGKEGHTGNSTGPHLHYEVRKSLDSKTHVDPLAYVKAYDSGDTFNPTTSSTTITKTTPGTGLLGAIEILSSAQSNMFSPLNDAITQLSQATANMYGTNSTTTTETIPGSSSSGFTSTSVSGSTNAEKIWNYLTQTMGLNKYGAAGFMGNLEAESNLNPKNLQGSYEKSLRHTDDSYTSAVDSGKYTNFVHDKAGYGLAQWTWHSRKKNMYDFLKSKGLSIGDLGGQLDFLNKEMSGTYSGLLNKLKNAPSLRTASNWVLTEFEKPADQGAKAQNKRANFGQSYLNQFGGEDLPISINGDYVNRFSGSSNVRNYRRHLPLGGEDMNVSIPDKVYEVLDKIINALLDIAKNTKSTSDGIEKIETKTSNSSNTAVVNQSTTNNNNPIYSAATNQRTNEKQKKYTVAKNIAMGIQ